MSAEFNWWLLIVGLVAGGALTWLVLADSIRRDREIGDEELRGGGRLDRPLPGEPLWTPTSPSACCGPTAGTSASPRRTPWSSRRTSTKLEAPRGEPGIRPSSRPPEPVAGTGFGLTCA